MGIFKKLFFGKASASGGTDKVRSNSSCEIDYLWNYGDEEAWHSALERYRSRLSGNQIALEEKMIQNAAERVRKFSAEEFYDFLYNQYFVWKYTAKNRLATTRKQLRRYIEENRLYELEQIRDCLFEKNHSDVKACFETVKKIHGLGTAGASGLLAILFPKDFGTVDQFVVKSLVAVRGLAEGERLKKINPEAITVKDAELLEGIMRRKAEELNKRFKTTCWTPRKVDMILWAIRT